MKARNIVTIYFYNECLNFSNILISNDNICFLFQNYSYTKALFEKRPYIDDKKSKLPFSLYIS